MTRPGAARELERVVGEHNSEPSHVEDFSGGDGTSQTLPRTFELDRVVPKSASQRSTKLQLTTRLGGAELVCRITLGDRNGVWFDPLDPTHFPSGRTRTTLDHETLRLLTTLLASLTPLGTYGANRES